MIGKEGPSFGDLVAQGARGWPQDPVFLLFEMIV